MHSYGRAEAPSCGEGGGIFFRREIQKRVSVKMAALKEGVSEKVSDWLNTTYPFFRKLSYIRHRVGTDFNITVSHRTKHNRLHDLYLVRQKTEHKL